MSKKNPKVLVIAGSDSGGGAGIQADLKTISANGAYASTAITSITAQNTLGVQAISDIPLKMIEAQITSVLSDIGANVIKTGMLSSKSIIKLVSRVVDKYKIPLVLDPVMVSKSGSRLLKRDAITSLKRDLLPKAFLVTPNIPEAEVISGIKIKNAKDMEAAADIIIKKYKCNAVLIKGGHLRGEDLVDILMQKDSKKVLVIKAKKIKTRNTHGTGCTYASAIAAEIAKQLVDKNNSKHRSIEVSDNKIIESSVRSAHKYLYNAIKKSTRIGKGHSPVNHFWDLKKD